ncbi:hypothetical protein [Paenibacillus sophorae]|uniref:hypothetical protein n=1 Tax=Paenibacillus sophorae TaxID=1333845 RepID=UPI000B836AA4|nr:hypothetical protein [Paenibacillus sophorae]
MAEIIDGRAFMQFAAGDSVLLTSHALSSYFMDECFKMIKNQGIDIFDMLQDIAGKPLQTYTSTVDEFGNITDMRLNQPKLKLV